MGVITQTDVEIDAGAIQCPFHHVPKSICNCTHEIDEESESDAESAKETTSVGGTDTLSLAAGHTCDFEYCSNLAKFGIPFSDSDIERYISLLNKTPSAENDAVLNIGRQAFTNMQPNHPHDAALLRGLVAVSGFDLDPEDTAQKAKLDPALKNDPDAAFKAALNIGAPAPAGPGFRSQKPCRLGLVLC